MAYGSNYNSESADDKVEKTYLAMLTETLNSARLKWEKPWLRSITSFMPQGFDGKCYRGTNLFLLSYIDQTKSYSTPIHMTFQRALAEGLCVKKDEHGDIIWHYSSYYLPTDEGKLMGMKYLSEEDYNKLPAETKDYYFKVNKARAYTVFNLDQTNIREVNPELFKKMIERFTQLEGERENTRQTTIKALDDTIRDNTWVCPIQTEAIGQAYYSPRNNLIKVPDKKDFKDDVSFYRTLVHEMIHSTAGLPKWKLTPSEEKLLASENCPAERREQLEQRKAEPLRTFNYGVLVERAREEMVAELGSAMVLTQMGIDAAFAPENQAYLQSWSEHLGLKEVTGLVENPQITEFIGKLQQTGWSGNPNLLLKDTVAVGIGGCLNKVFDLYRVPESPEIRDFLGKVRDRVISLTTEGTKLVPISEEERKNRRADIYVLGDIVKDAWKAAKVVMSEGLKLDLKKDIKQGEDFSKVNDKRRDESATKDYSKRYGSKSTKSSSYKSSGRKYGR